MRRKNAVDVLKAAVFAGMAGMLVSCMPEVGGRDALQGEGPGGGDEGTLTATRCSRMPGQPEGSDADAYRRDAAPDRRPGIPLTSFQSRNFVGASRCANCHELLADKHGNDMSISNHWRSTMMANAAKDPVWQAKVSSEVSRTPAFMGIIESKCALCHMPMAWTQTKADNEAYPGILGKGYLDPATRLHEAAMDGVSCTLCHQIQDRNLGNPMTFSGKFVIDAKAQAPDRPIFGPYANIIGEIMRTSVGYTPVQGMQVEDGGFCATCHTLFTPYVDSQGRIAGEFPEQTPYLEWLHSEYRVAPGERYSLEEATRLGNGTKRICQECHMPHSPEGRVVIARYAPKGVEPKEHFSQHHFVGGNALMLDLMRDNAGALGITASTDKLEDSRERTVRQLSNDTVELAVTDAGGEGGNLSLTVEIASKVGHKFPTGFPARRAWLHFSLTDAEGRVVFESGRPAEDGSIAGNDNDENGSRFEPHYDRITRQDQVQVYESIMMDTDSQVTYTLLRAARYVKDNRLLPRGFVKETASEDIAVHGEAKGDPNFSGGGDRITYAVAVEDRRGPFTAEVELLYSPLSFAFTRDLERDRDQELVERFSGMLARADKRPVAVATARVVVR